MLLGQANAIFFSLSGSLHSIYCKDFIIGYCGTAYAITTFLLQRTKSETVRQECNFPLGEASTGFFGLVWFAPGKGDRLNFSLADGFEQGEPGRQWPRLVGGLKVAGCACKLESVTRNQ